MIAQLQSAPPADVGNWLAVFAGLVGVAYLCSALAKNVGWLRTKAPEGERDRPATRGDLDDAVAGIREEFAKLDRYTREEINMLREKQQQAALKHENDRLELVREVSRAVETVRGEVNEVRVMMGRLDTTIRTLMEALAAGRHLITLSRSPCAIAGEMTQREEGGK